MLPKGAVQALGVLSLLFALVAFVIIYGAALVRTWIENDPISFNDPTLYVGSLVLGLIGGIIAAGAGVDWDPPANDPSKKKTLSLGIGVVSYGLTRPDIRIPSQAQWMNWVGWAYALAFFVIGVAGVVTWIARAQVVSEFIAAMAWSFLGLAIAIARAWSTRPPAGG